MIETGHNDPKFFNRLVQTRTKDAMHHSLTLKKDKISNAHRPADPDYETVMKTQLEIGDQKPSEFLQ